jgi:hypothetical protein
MGQYHHPVCIEAEEGLDPAGMDSGLKEGEQGFNRPSTPAAIVALVCARGGNMPADCSQSPLIGRWAGKRVLIQGDYAEDDDIPDWKGPTAFEALPRNEAGRRAEAEEGLEKRSGLHGYHTRGLRFSRSRL